MKKLTLHNYEPQQHNNHLQIDLIKSHEDYLDEFLNETKICLLNHIHLRVGYHSLRKVTNDFTRDETRINSSQIIRLSVCGKIVERIKLQQYFTHAKIV